MSFAPGEAYQFDWSHEIVLINGVTVTVSALGRTGPSVSPLNGVISSLAATEFMAAVTGMRAPVRLLEYRGREAKVVVVTDPPTPDCYYCKGIRGTGAAAGVERYLDMPYLR